MTPTRRISLLVLVMSLVSVVSLAGDEFKDTIGKVPTVIMLGDMTRSVVDAYIIPEFEGGASYGGVGAAVARGGGAKGLEAYDAHLVAKGRIGFGEVLVTESGGGNAKFHIHAVTVGSGADQEFAVIKQAIYRGLKAAASKGIRTIAAPALGTGITGALTPDQSAQAMLGALYAFEQEGNTFDEFRIVIYGDKGAYAAFVKVLQNKRYVGRPEPLVGLKEFDYQKWVDGMDTMKQTIKEFRKPQAPVESQCSDLLADDQTPKKEKKSWRTWFGR